MKSISKPTKYLAVLGTARVPFLILSPLCVTVAVAYAHFKSLEFYSLQLVLCYLGATLAHMSVNMLNEYHDAKTGLDNHTIRTAFNGGSGTLQQMPQYASFIRNIAWLLLVIVAGIGIYFVTMRGIDLLILGILGVLAVAFYTPVINRMPFICLLAPGFGFACVMIIGTCIALTGYFDTDIMLLSAPVLLIVNNLLLMNQFPDRRADESAGRRHLIICYGYHAGKLLYLLQLLLAALFTIAIIFRFDFLFFGLLLLLPFAFGIFAFYGLYQFSSSQDARNFVPYMAANTALSLSYPTLMIFALVFEK